MCRLCEVANLCVKGKIRSEAIINMFFHPFSKYVLNIYFVPSTGVNPGDAAVNKTKFLLLGTLCSSGYLNMPNCNVSSGGKDSEEK